MSVVLRRQLSLFVPLVLLAAMSLSPWVGCGAVVHTATKEPRSLSYVGKVQFGVPVQEQKHVVVPLKYVGGQWGLNSAHVPAKVESVIMGRRIALTVVTSVPVQGADPLRGYRLILPGDCRGKYTVFYLDPDGTEHPLGEIEIAI